MASTPKRTEQTPGVSSVLVCPSCDHFYFTTRISFAKSSRSQRPTETLLAHILVAAKSSSDRLEMSKLYMFWRTHAVVSRAVATSYNTTQHLHSSPVPSVHPLPTPKTPSSSHHCQLNITATQTDTRDFFHIKIISECEIFFPAFYRMALFMIGKVRLSRLFIEWKDVR